MEDVEEKEVDTTEVEEKEKDTKSQTGADEKEAGKKEEGKSFTQEQVNAIMAKEKKQGRNSVVTDFGFKTEAEAKAEMAAYSKWKESQKTEEQKASEKATADSQAKVEAENRAKLAEAKVEAMVLGVKPNSVDDIIALAMNKLTDDGDLKTVISELKSKYPSMFNDGASEDDKDKNEKKTTGQKGTGGNVKNDAKGSKDEEPKGLGARLAAQRGKSNKKSTYFGNK